MVHDASGRPQMFSSPTMVARASAVRVLALLDETERAMAAGDRLATLRLTGAALDRLRVATDALAPIYATANLEPIADSAAAGIAQYQAEGR